MPKSIECLYNISKNNKLGFSMCKLSIYLCLMEEGNRERGINKGQYMEYLDEQKSATTGGTDFDMFRAALANLCNCRSIYIFNDNRRPI